MNASMSLMLLMVLSIVALAANGCGPLGGQSTSMKQLQAFMNEKPPAERFVGNPLFDPDFVPICVGGQRITNARIYRDAGVNIYYTIDDVVENPTRPYERRASAETLKELSDLGMYAFVSQEVWGHLADNPTIIAWSSPVDEPDNRQKHGGPTPLDEYLAEAARFKAGDPTRPFVVCFGQGVINDGFGGRALDRSMYPAYMAPVDLIHYDFYPIANFKWNKNLPRPKDGPPVIWRHDGEWHLDMVGQGVSRIRRWTDNKKPIMAWIETSHNHNPARMSTPAQTVCEVWDAVVHGVRGIGYFSHDFTLPLETGQADALSKNKVKLAALKVTNAKLQKLARIVSAPIATEPTEATCPSGGKVIYSTKVVDRLTHEKEAKPFAAVLAVNVYDQPAKATIYVVGLKKGTKIEVLEEGRTLEAAVPGAFIDDFSPLQEHIYRIVE